MKKYLPIVIVLVFLILYKSGNLGVRLSDTNIYFYTGYQLLQGKILYKDIFFTNFPLLPYLSSLYFLLTGGSINLFFLTPIIEICTVGFLIYFIVYKQHKSAYLAFLTSILYLFSFIVLSTSDHQTGVFFASIVSLTSYYFYLNKRYVISGAFLALALLTKAYFLPILLTFLTMIVIKKNWKELLNFLIGAGMAGIIVMLPSLIFAFPDFIKDVFQYSLTRSQGIGKSNIAWFFITHDFLLFVLMIFSIVNLKKNKFLGLMSIFGIVFFLLYQDIYYLYLNFMVPFLVLSFPGFYNSVQKNFNLQKAIIPTILIPFLLYNFIIYNSNFRNLQKLSEVEKIVEAIKKENPKALYGVNDITPLLSYKSGVPLLNGVIDTNANIYRKGILNAQEMTKDAISQKALLVTHGLNYPEQGVEESVTDEIFDTKQVKKSCKLVKSFPVQMEGPQNRLNLLRCY